jgi:hypothetical protein
VPLLALSTAHEIGLAATAAVFIAYSLVCSMLIPRRRPDFPGKALPAFIVATAVLFVAMLTAVWVFGVEESEPTSERAPAAVQSAA